MNHDFFSRVWERMNEGCRVRQSFNRSVNELELNERTVEGSLSNKLCREWSLFEILLWEWSVTVGLYMEWRIFKGSSVKLSLFETLCGKYLIEGFDRKMSLFTFKLQSVYLANSLWCLYLHSAGFEVIFRVKSRFWCWVIIIWNKESSTRRRYSTWLVRFIGAIKLQVYVALCVVIILSPSDSERERGGGIVLHVAVFLWNVLVSVWRRKSWKMSSSTFVLKWKVHILVHTSCQRVSNLPEGRLC